MAAHSRGDIDQAPRPRNGQVGKTPLKELLLDSPQATFALGERIGRHAKGGTVIALRGGLGAGKTLLTKGIAKGLGIEDEVTSPTYTIVSEYEGRLRLHHVDAWRLAGADELAAVGGDDLLADLGGIAVIEWSENVSAMIGPDAITIELEVRDGDSRLARVSGPVPDGWMRT